MASNSTLHNSKASRNDEFYTLYETVENELKHYGSHFRNRTIYCNCDDFRSSNFVKYFIDRFDEIGVRKLIASCYSQDGKGFYYIKERGIDTCGIFDGDGSFSSDECIKFLKEADVVVSNPPFSKMRDYLSMLEEHGKKYLFIGNMNAITYKEVYKLIQDNKLWLGITLTGLKCCFKVPEWYESKTTYEDGGVRYCRINNAIWFTNLDHDRRHDRIELQSVYDPYRHAHYDNFDGVNINKVADIPSDYEGNMGVPITFLHRYNPDQFEIVRFRKGDDGKDLAYTQDGQTVQPYFRIIIRKKKK